MNEPFNPKTMLRSPREKLGGYVLLPRLIDKVRLYAQGILPEEYHQNLLSLNKKPFDGRFLFFTGIDRDPFRQVILSSLDDHSVLQWVEQHAIKHTLQEKEQWAASLVQSFFEPTPEMISYLTRVYPKLTEFFDPNTLDSANPFDLIDYDEGRISYSEVLQRRK
jgi:hypothetical protein